MCIYIYIHTHTHTHTHLQPVDCLIHIKPKHVAVVSVTVRLFVQQISLFYAPYHLFENKGFEWFFLVRLCRIEGAGISQSVSD